MATKHKQPLGLQSYLSHHKNVSSMSKSSTSSFVSGLPASVSKRFLPDEMLLKVFSYLDVVSLLRASQVNKRWCCLTKDDSLWKTIAQKFANAGDPPKCGKDKKHPEHSKSLGTKWKNVCIARCAEQRDKLVLKLMKKTHLNPFTGLPRDTEKALKTSGVTFQLALVDTYGKECCVQSSRLSFHKSSMAMTWHSLDFMPLIRVRRLRVLAVCPLFYEGGKAVKGSPYQRSVLWEADVRLSDWRAKKHSLGTDGQVKLFQIPGDLLMATWEADGELAFFAAGLHFDNLVQRCLRGTPTQCFLPQPHTPVPDDIDSSYGLHDYRATVELRSVGQTMWSQQFQGLHCRPEDLSHGVATLILIRHDRIVDHTPLERNMSLPWRSELFNGSVKNAAWIDVTVLDERGEVFFAASSPVKGDKPASEDTDLEYEDCDHLLVNYEGDRAAVHMKIGKLDHGKAFVRYLEIQVKVAAINEWFGTKYKSK